MEKDRDERRTEIQRLEKRQIQREENLDKKIENFERREKQLSAKEADITSLQQDLQKKLGEEIVKLEQMSQISREEARDMLLKRVEDEIQFEIVTRLKNMEEEIKRTADIKAKKIIATAIQKWAADQVVETTVSIVELPNDEMKGRIIGREGRNIRLLENLTGIDLIIDDTPQAVILSGFNPIRREIAKMTLQKLIIDGRIHPARIEETFEKAKQEMEQIIWQVGEQATFETGISGIHTELIKLLGKLKFRTSYGQNVLQHSLEVSFLAGAIAQELGLNPAIAKRAGLLHDIGKALDIEMEGSHAIIGAKFAERYHEHEEIIHAIAAHHEDEEPKTVEAILIQACDALSAARPSARRETLEMYVKRLEQLENVANSFPGIEKAFAIQAGREVRIMVKPEHFDDAKTVLLARDIVKKIEEELQYPGQIKVTVVRETRAVEFAK